MMKFFKDPANWKQEISEIGLTAGFILFLLSFLVLGNPSIWLLFSCVPLLIPLIFGSRWKMKLPALLIIILSGWIIFTWADQRKPVIETSNDGNNHAILVSQGNNNCYTVKIDGQVFYTHASIYHNAKSEWQGNDLFILKSSDVGDIEFRKENGVWKASPESLIRKRKDVI